jgi:hypothetical protein
VAGEQARVYLHDGTLRRVGQLSTAEGVNRSYVLGGQGVATVTVSPTDDLIADADPRLGRILVIESTIYPEPWVGKLTEARMSGGRDAVQLRAVGFDRVLEQRILGAGSTFKATAPSVVEQILQSANGVNPTGIEVGAVADTGVVFEGSFPQTSARQAIDSVAAHAGLEWWLEFGVTSSSLSIELHADVARGEDRSGEVEIADGGTGDWTEWVINAEALALSLSVVGGQANATQAFNDQPASKADFSGVEVFAPHGYAVEGEGLVGSTLTAAEKVAFADYVQSKGQTAKLAQELLKRGGVTRSIRVTCPSNRDIWGDLRVGNVVNLRAPGAFLGDFEGPVRILGVQPSEESGQASVVTQILVPR